MKNRDLQQPPAGTREEFLTARQLAAVLQVSETTVRRLARKGRIPSIRLTSESGEFVFRLTPDAAKYRVTARAEGAEPATKDVEIDGAAVYRIALSLQPAQK